MIDVVRGLIAWIPMGLPAFLFVITLVVFFHELGHFLGFGHSTDPHNLMYPEIQDSERLSTLVIDSDMLHTLTN